MQVAELQEPEVSEKYFQKGDPEAPVIQVGDRFRLLSDAPWTLVPHPREEVRVPAGAEGFIIKADEGCLLQFDAHRHPKHPFGYFACVLTVPGKTHYDSSWELVSRAIKGAN